jgi:hypothetical protein
MTTDTKTINEICIVSRAGVCLLDMKQVADKAKELGLPSLAELIERDLSENKITDGSYYSAVASLYGAN